MQTTHAQIQRLWRPLLPTPLYSNNQTTIDRHLKSAKAAEDRLGLQAARAKEPKVAGNGLKPTPFVPARPASEPQWVRKIRKELPPYADELLAFLLIGIGLLSFLTLLSPESGEIGSALSGVLTRLFGAGAFVVPGVILAAGAALLVPRLGIPVRVNWWRFTLGEIVYVVSLAYLHATIRASVGGEP